MTILSAGAVSYISFFLSFVCRKVFLMQNKFAVEQYERMKNEKKKRKIVIRRPDYGGLLLDGVNEKYFLAGVFPSILFHFPPLVFFCSSCV